MMPLELKIIRQMLAFDTNIFFFIVIQRGKFFVVLIMLIFWWNFFSLFVCVGWVDCVNGVDMSKIAKLLRKKPHLCQRCSCRV